MIRQIAYAALAYTPMHQPEPIALWGSLMFYFTMMEELRNHETELKVV